VTKEKFFFFLLSLILILPFLFVLLWPSQRLQLIACNVGQGDAILLTKGFTQILIDGGPNNKVLDCLASNLPFWDRTIELVVNTHPDKDHITGLADVIERYSVKQMISNSIWVDTQVFKNFHQQVVEKRIPVYSPKKGEKIKISGLEFTVLWPEERIANTRFWQKKEEKQETIASRFSMITGEDVLGESAYPGKSNDLSIVLHLKYKDFDAILTGDITDKVEKQIIQDYQFKDIEVLKVAHHGSKYSSCQEFLEKVNPGVAIISVGKNPWGHPTKEVLNRLQSIGAKVLRTDQQKIKLKI